MSENVLYICGAATVQPLKTKVMKASKITEVEINHYDDDLRAWSIDVYGTGDTGAEVGYITDDGRVFVPDADIKEKCKEAINDHLREMGLLK